MCTVIISDCTVITWSCAVAHGHAMAKVLCPLSRTHLWWCATSPLAFLPIHAAGIYSKDTNQGSSLPTVAVSSYTPTVSSLVDRTHKKQCCILRGY